MDEPLSHSNEKEQGELLTIDGDPVFEEGPMFERGVHLYVFIVCVLLMRIQQICFRNGCWKKETQIWMVRVI